MSTSNNSRDNSSWPPAKEVLNDFQDVWATLEQEDISSADYYFNSYAHIGIHEDMLKDNVCN